MISRKRELLFDSSGGIRTRVALATTGTAPVILPYVAVGCFRDENIIKLLY